MTLQILRKSIFRMPNIEGGELQFMAHFTAPELYTSRYIPDAKNAEAGSVTLNICDAS